MAYIPMELITEVLLRLPVKSLLRSCCVSKRWESSIKNPDFIKLHLNQSLQNKTNQALIIRDCDMYSLDFPTLNQISRFNHPLGSGKGTELLGSCNGLLCLWNGDEQGIGTIFYNPATRKYHELPASLIEFSENAFCCERVVYGFGYDCVSDDYKLVRVIQFDGRDEFDSEVKVYSLKSGSWRRVCDFPRDYYLTFKRGWGIHVNGCLHWVVTCDPDDDGPRFIISFDLRTEEYKFVPQPDYLDDEFHMNVDVLNGCLCVLSNYVNVKFDVWIMEEYGLQESWTKLFTITQGVNEILGSFEYVRPLAYSNDGSSVLLVRDSKDLIWFDWERQTVKIVEVPDHLPLHDTGMMVQSLVPLECHQNKKEEKLKKKNEHSKQKGKKSKQMRGDMDGFLAKGFKLKL